MTPTYDNVFVTQVERRTTTASGIILTGEVESGLKPAKILAIGPDCVISAVGAECYVKWGDTAPITEHGTQGAVVSETKILAFIK